MHLTINYSAHSENMREKLHTFAPMLSCSYCARLSGKDRPHTPCTFVSTLPRPFMQDIIGQQCSYAHRLPSDHLWKNINLLC